MDSDKTKTKKDKKEQRRAFREILAYLEDEDEDEDNGRESVEQPNLSTWKARHLYAVLKTSYGPGLHAHLSKNNFIRNLFKMEPVYPDAANTQHLTSGDHSRRRLAKAKTIVKSKNQDKKQNVINNV